MQRHLVRRQVRRAAPATQATQVHRKARTLATGRGDGRGRTTKSSDSVTWLWRALRAALSEAACARRVGLGRRGAVGGNVHLVQNRRRAYLGRPAAVGSKRLVRAD